MVRTSIRPPPYMVRLEIITTADSLEGGWLSAAFTYSVGSTKNIDLYSFAPLVDIPLALSGIRVGR
jgi:hypothetical protein